ncbi:unnamed protein product [Ostreobium quekettii]|uniref:Formamidopyrimidine-DNA glycosylase catalytic domain-containing protein n=1 Tax=Ostreobium quekettii TaxID=121088 RepID=A0A8S1IW39_9CHLO|nr:unnamed protein product [Ostreobium quekettii]
MESIGTGHSQKPNSAWAQRFDDMPELPEVEAYRRLVEVHCLKKKISRVAGGDDNVVFTTPGAPVRERFLHRKIMSAKRLGKNLWLEMDVKGPQPLFHFGMTGAIVVNDVDLPTHWSGGSKEWPPRFMKLSLDFVDGTQMAFVDVRRFARMQLVDNPPNSSPLKELGFDPLLNHPSISEFTELLRQHSGKLKTLLLDQSFAAGIGNWVADDVLYNAQIHPEHQVNDLTVGQIAALHKSIGYVIRTAVEAGADSSKFPEDWLFHVRWGRGKKNQTLAKVKGHNVAFTKVNSRTTAFVPALQKLPPKVRSRSKSQTADGDAKITGAKGLKSASGAENKSQGKQGRGSMKEDVTSDYQSQKAAIQEANADGAGMNAPAALRRRGKVKADDKTSAVHKQGRGRKTARSMQGGSGDAEVHQPLKKRPTRKLRKS